MRFFISVRDSWPVASLTEWETWTESMVVKPRAALIPSLRARGGGFNFRVVTFEDEVAGAEGGGWGRGGGRWLFRRPL